MGHGFVRVVHALAGAAASLDHPRIRDTLDLGKVRAGVAVVRSPIVAFRSVTGERRAAPGRGRAARRARESASDGGEAPVSMNQMLSE
jgi:hypothetical protein